MHSLIDLHYLVWFGWGLGTLHVLPPKETSKFH